jgi:hypothetical protein
MDRFSVFSRFSPIPPLSFAPPPMPQPQIIKNQRQKTTLTTNHQIRHHHTNHEAKRQRRTPWERLSWMFIFSFGHFPFRAFSLYFYLLILRNSKTESCERATSRARPYMLLISDIGGCCVL